MLDFSALLPKDLFTFAFVVFWSNYNLHVGFRNFCKKLTLKINQLKIKSPIIRQPLFLFDAVVGENLSQLRLHNLQYAINSVGSKV